MTGFGNGPQQALRYWIMGRGAVLTIRHGGRLFAYHSETLAREAVAAQLPPPAASLEETVPRVHRIVLGKVEKLMQRSFSGCEQAAGSIRTRVHRDDLATLKLIRALGAAAGFYRHLTEIGEATLTSRVDLMLSRMSGDGAQQGAPTVPGSGVAPPAVTGDGVARKTKPRRRRKKKPMNEDVVMPASELAVNPSASTGGASAASVAAFADDLCDEWADSLPSRGSALVAVRPARQLARGPSDESAQPTPKQPRGAVQLPPGGSQLGSAATVAFSCGQRVVLQNLVRRAELNGSTATTVKFLDDVSKWVVELVSGETVQVQADRLRPSIFG